MYILLQPYDWEKMECFMKNKILVFIIIVIGFAVVACDFLLPDEPSIIGTWKGGSEEVTFKDDNTFQYFIPSSGTIRGDYTYDSKTVSMTLTHRYSSGNWVESTAANNSSWRNFDGRSRNYEIKKWTSGRNEGKYYINISDVGIWGKYLTKQ